MRRLEQRLADDPAGAFEDLVRVYQDRLFAFAFRLTGSRQDAEEVVQDALVRAYRALSGYGSERVRTLRLKPWLYRITLNVSRNRRRGRRLETVPLADDAGDLMVDASAMPPDRVHEGNEQRRELASLVAALPVRYRAAVILRHVNGLGYTDAALALGQPVGTVKSNASRGLARLRRLLEKHIQEER
jgi:RNA polymerase sigma-70 factor (ECF subfamily)